MGLCEVYNTTLFLIRICSEFLIVSGRINTSTEDISLFFLIIISFLIISRRKLLLKRKQSALDNKIFSYTCYDAFDIANCETVEDSIYYYNYIVVGYSCDHEVSK